MVKLFLHQQIWMNLDNFKTFDEIELSVYAKYLKGRYRNTGVFKRSYMSQLKSTNMTEKLCVAIVDEFKKAKPFTFKEAFEIKNDQFRALVFTSINVPEMVKELGSTLLKVEGIKVQRKQYSNEGELLGNKEYDNVYETYEVSGKKMGVENIYALKCWCTSTNKEHWLWIDEKFKNDPLSAVASTFFIHNNIKPFISCIKRQGDVMLAELSEEITPEGEMSPLTKEEYFGLLVAES